MPQKKKDQGGSTQTTLSKFFTPTASVKTNSKKNAMLNSTDEKDDFEVVEINPPKKRPNSKPDDSHEGQAPSKKICTQGASGDDGKNKDSHKPGMSSSPSSISLTFETTKNKLSQFELSETQDSDVERSSFQSKDCFMVPFTDVKKGEVADNTVQDDNNEDEEENISSSLCAFMNPNTKVKSNSKGSKGSGDSKPTKYTPLEQQVVDIKEQRPDVLLCVECGYKYRFFGEDAEVAAKVLKIFCHLDHNFMTASIPTHRLFVHVRRLVAAGYKVGVVKQMETAHLKAASDNKSGPFTRKLAALYTNDDDGNRPDHEATLKQNQNLLCIYEQPQSSDSTSNSQHIGIVCADPATGDVLYDDFHDGAMHSELATRISHLGPVEIVLSSEASTQLKNFVTKISSLSLTDDDKIRVEMVPEKNFTEAVSIVKEFYEDVSSACCVLNFAKPTLSCVAALCVYLKDFQLEGVLKLSQAFRRFSERSRFMHLSSQCLHNLEVFQNSCDRSEKGSLFWMLDNTKTKFGSRLLRKWLNQPLLDYKEIQGRLNAVEELIEGGSAGMKTLSDLMGKVPDLERGLCSIFHQKCSPLEFHNVVHFLGKVCKTVKGLDNEVNSPLLKSLLSRMYDGLDGIWTYNKSINEKAARDNDLPNLFVFGLEDDGVAAVYSTKEKLADVLAEIHDHRRDVRIALRQPGLNFTTVLQTEFLIEVKNTQLKTVPSDWTQISSTKTVTRFHTPYLVEKYRKLNELREQLEKDAKEAWQIFLKQFSASFVTYKMAVTHLATLDCLMGLAKVALQGSFCKPQVDAERVHIKIVQGRHPIIDALSSGQDQFVPNDTNLSADKGPRVMTVSGPNMGGKSSYIRQVALITIMAQIGSYVPAESASLGIFDAVYTRMGASDEIFQGRSTFMVELHEASEIMAQASERSLVILDELGRGTSTHDGVAIAFATLKHFITKCGCLVMFVTHFPMMSEFQAQFPDIVCNYHMAFLLGEGQDEDCADVLTFLYQLTKGAAARSYGLNVARLAQVPGDILQLAAQKSKLLEKALAEKRTLTEKFSKIYHAKAEELQVNLNS
ncbi:DNA mismatch repair protein Msh3 [Elysia marginata]|uniref:DNA mismatch repair protein MSH3 n=1 Tax=Elysia marginata TaxID=1093978 RepID=A0AAV4HQL5_9GAST|nr:DNA mismatch repair protein Msh3 [Elysia marginata]